jgi:hypothetical protein
VKQVTIAPTDGQQRQIDAESNPAFAALIGANPAQIDAWLINNVTNIAQSRAVLKSLLLAVRFLHHEFKAIKR